MAFNRDSSLDISLGAGSWSGGASDGTTLWFVNRTNDQARCLRSRDQARDSAKDIALGTGAWTGGASDGTTLWFVDDTSNQAIAYVAATRARDAAKDIALGTGAWQGGVSDGTTLWLVIFHERSSGCLRSRHESAGFSQRYRSWYGSLVGRSFRWHHALVYG